MHKLTIYIASFCFMLAPYFVHAGPIIRTGEKISIDSEQTLMGDFYGFAPAVTISGAAEHDVYVGGGSVTINAPVAQDLTVVGGTVQIHGDIGDDLRVVGGDITIGKKVKGDVVVVGGVLTVLSTANIEGDILMMGGDLVIEGDVAGGVHGSAENVRINSTIGGNVSVVAKTLAAFGDNAHIKGDVSYESNTDIARAQNAQFDGDVHRTEVQSPADSPFLKTYLFELCMLLFATLTAFLLLRPRLITVTKEAVRVPGHYGLIGLGIFFITPLVGGLFLVSVLGAFVGICIILLYLVGLILSFVLSAILIGFWIQKFVFKKEDITLSTIISGVGCMTLLGFVPFFGGFVIFGCTLIVLGTIHSILFKIARQ